MSVSFGDGLVGVVAGRRGGGGGPIGGTVKRMVWWVVIAAVALAVWNGLGHDPRAWRANLVARSAEVSVWAHEVAGNVGLPVDGSAPAWSTPVGPSTVKGPSAVKPSVQPAAKSAGKPVPTVVK